MNESQVCPDCQVPMEEGFVPDRGEGYTYLPCWHPGSPEMGMSGIKGFVLGELIGMNRIPITSFRCPECGGLKFYANTTRDDL